MLQIRVSAHFSKPTGTEDMVILVTSPIVIILPHGTYIHTTLRLFLSLPDGPLGALPTRYVRKLYASCLPILETGMPVRAL